MSSDAEKMINFTVGGLNFCLSAADIDHFPDSYFAHLLKDEWHADRSQVVNLDRDGQAFRTIHNYIVNGFNFSLGYEFRNLDKLLAIQREADFYNLPKLVTIWEQHIECQMKNIIGKISANDTASFECVSESEDVATDPLVQAMHPLRPRCIATSHFHAGQIATNISNDIVKHSLLPFLEDPLKSTKHVGCRVLSRYFLSDTCRWKIQRKLKRWPLNAKHTVKDSDENIFAFKEGASMTQRFTGSDRFLYIYAGSAEGGVVSATVNGVTVRINQTDDCMALAAGVSYSVDTVVEGSLILIEFRAHPGYSWCPETPELEWTEHGCDGVDWSANSETKVLSTSVGENIVATVGASLDKYVNVMLCLNQYYPITYSHDCNRRFETDSDVLTGADAALYALLCTVYDVEVVTAYVRYVDRVSELHPGARSCVLDFITPQVHADETASSGDAAVLAPVTTKTVAPLYGYGIKCGSAGAILTALMVSDKVR